jgi:hypothetical protein
MVVEWIKENCRQPSDDRFHVTPNDLDKARFEFRNVSKKACDIGSEAHNAIEKHLQGKDYALITKRAKRSFQAFLDWQKEVDLKPIKLEHTVWGDRWAGTLDFVGNYKGKLYVIDWKTSKAFYPEMNYQVAAYRNAAQYPCLEDICNSNGFYPLDKIEGCGILRLDKEFGMPYFKDTSKSYERDFVVFNFMVDLFYARHPRIRKKFEETP